MSGFFRVLGFQGGMLPLASLSPRVGRGWPTEPAPYSIRGRERGCRSRLAFQHHDSTSAVTHVIGRTRCIADSDDPRTPAFPSPAFGTLSPLAGRGTRFGAFAQKFRFPFLRPLALSASLLLLGACATRTAREAPPLDQQGIEAAERAQASRASWLDAQRQWSFEGRVAINNAGKGGNGRIEWQQDGRSYVVSLIAPITRQSWRLIGDTHSEAGRLEGLEGGTREGEDAEALLLEATGWDIPVNALAQWVRGLPAEGFPLQEWSYSTQGQLQLVEQAGWRIEYPLWFPAEGPQPSLPRRIEAKRDRASVRLIVDHWDFSAQ